MSHGTIPLPKIWYLCFRMRDFGALSRCQSLHIEVNMQIFPQFKESRFPANYMKCTIKFLQSLLSLRRASFVQSIRSQDLHKPYINSSITSCSSMTKTTHHVQKPAPSMKRVKSLWRDWHWADIAHSQQKLVANSRKKKNPKITKRCLLLQDQTASLYTSAVWLPSHKSLSHIPRGNWWW